MFTFHDADKKFEMKGDLLKMITVITITLILLKDRIKNQCLNLQLICILMEKNSCKISLSDKSNLRIIQSPPNMGGLLKESKTRFLSSNPNELRNRLK